MNLRWLCLAGNSIEVRGGWRVASCMWLPLLGRWGGYEGNSIEVRGGWGSLHACGCRYWVGGGIMKGTALRSEGVGGCFMHVVDTIGWVGDYEHWGWRISL